MADTQTSPTNKRMFASIIVKVLAVTLRVGFRLQVRGAENLPTEGPILVVINHRRDSDGPILGYVLATYGHDGLPNFVAREDLFHRGFLRDYVEKLTLLREVLGPINLGRLAWAAGMRPIRRIPERSLGEVLNDVLEQLGDRPLSGILRPQWVQTFGATGRDLSIRDALAAMYRPLLQQRHGLHKLTLDAFRELKGYHRSVIEQQLRHFTDLLEQGATLVLAPEGKVSDSGDCARPRAALHTLINQPRVAPQVLPVSLTYDSMTLGRPTVFVNIGKPCSDLRGLSRRDTDFQVSLATNRLLTVTASQLLGRFIYCCRTSDQLFDADKAVAHVAREVQHCADSGLWIDPTLLNDTGLRERMWTCLRYCQRKSILQRGPSGHYIIAAAQSQTPTALPAARDQIDYLNNEFDTLWHFHTAIVGTEGV